MKSRSKMFFAVPLGVLLLSGCGNDSTQEELLSYLNGPYEDFLLMYDDLEYHYDLYDDAGAEGNDEEVLDIIQQDIIPQYNLMYDHLTELELDEQEVSELNDLLIEETNYNHQAVQVEEEAFISVLENGEDADELFDERDDYYILAEEALNEFDQYLNQLLEDYDLE